MINITLLGLFKVVYFSVPCPSFSLLAQSVIAAFELSHLLLLLVLVSRFCCCFDERFLRGLKVGLCKRDSKIIGLEKEKNKEAFSYNNFLSNFYDAEKKKILLLAKWEKYDWWIKSFLFVLSKNENDQ